MSVTTWLTMVAPTIALGIGVATIVQRNRADRRAEWWRRAQWSMDLAMGGASVRRVVGFAMAARLQHSVLAGAEERAFLSQFSDIAAAPLVGDPHGAPPDERGTEEEVGDGH